MSHLKTTRVRFYVNYALQYFINRSKTKVKDKVQSIIFKRSIKTK